MPGFGIGGRGKVDPDGVIREFELTHVSLISKPVDPYCVIRPIRSRKKGTAPAWAGVLVWEIAGMLFLILAVVATMAFYGNASFGPYLVGLLVGQAYVIVFRKRSNELADEYGKEKRRGSRSVDENLQIP